MKNLRKESVQVKFQRLLELEAVTKELNKELKALKSEVKELLIEHNETALKSGGVLITKQESTSLRFSKDLFIEQNSLEAYNSYKSESLVTKLIINKAS